MRTTIFTGGSFLLQNSKIKFFCHNTQHNPDISESMNRHIHDLHNSFSCPTYFTEGIHCDYRDHVQEIVLEPDRIRSLQHLSALNASEEEISFYLRSWGYISLESKNLVLPCQTDLSKTVMMEVVDIGPDDQWYNTRSIYKGRRIHVPHKNIKQSATPGIFDINTHIGFPNIVYSSSTLNSSVLRYKRCNEISTIFCISWTAKPIGTHSNPISKVG